MSAGRVAVPSREEMGSWLDSFYVRSSTCDLPPPSTSAGSRVLVLPYTKTTGSRGAKVVLCRQTASRNPVACVERHISVNGLGPALPLFSYRAPGGILCLTKKSFLKRCNSVWSSRGLPHLSGHSFRIGGNTEFLLRGVPPDVVKRMGRWSSDAFLRYWRSLEVIALLYAEYVSEKAPCQ